MHKTITTLEVRFMAGGCQTGRGRRRVTWHLLETPNAAASVSGRPAALCGRRPAIQWSDARDGQAATCPACLERLAARTTL